MDKGFLSTLAHELPGFLVVTAGPAATQHLARRIADLDHVAAFELALDRFDTDR